ncbi:MAG: polymer-forming cytoskeletal protein [Erysipelotrichia bacterium]|nr:polymer-forming cytoskeletal protein [Erysipelotrichia bacterium]NCC54327.1 polymer-forming cytoskeletal protein [Erysipelotrichia bacterium]
MAQMSLGKSQLIGGLKMRKSLISNFINKSRAIIDEELDIEQSNSTVNNHHDHENDGYIMKNFKGEKENMDRKDRKLAEEEKGFIQPNPSFNKEGVESTSTIAADVVITGNISAKGNLNFDGKIDGDIECRQNLKVGGAVKGNIKGSYVRLNCDKIEGNVECENLCEVLGNTAIKGDVTAANLIVEGSIVGTINAKEKVTLCATSVLEGDCVTARLKIDEGAIVKGNIQMVSDTKAKASKENK